ncbi:MAG: hypothetical protein HQL44_17055 [Alphaproteobacteria bacterium]|nr:hypothetical protein [Alphaproteobacteria bacterium]
MINSLKTLLPVLFLVGGCAATSAELQRLPPVSIVSFKSNNITKLARCVQYDLVTKKSENGPFLLGIGYKSEVMDNGKGEATVWGPSQGFPFYSVVFLDHRATIYAQPLPAYNVDEVAVVLSSVIADCDD